jgi:predicted outer membrane repeat protein
MGGGIYNEHSNQMLTNCIFIANFGGLGGGMSNIESNSTLTDCTYSENSATYGGGIFNDLSNPTLTNCTFTANMACPGEVYHVVTLSGTGGGMFNSFSSPKIMSCQFSGNLAKGDAGGIFNFAGGNLIVTNCTFNGNTTWHNGGAMHNWRNMPTISNCTFTSNSAIEHGGSIYNEGSEANIINCILWGDIATQGNEIYLGVYVNSRGKEYPSIMNVDYSDVDGGATGVYVSIGCTLNWVDGNIDTDPCFADANNGDYHLKSQAGRWDANSQSWVRDDSTSPCIDAGNPGCPLGDEPNDSNNVRVNMGAYGGTAEASNSPAYWRSIADMTNDWIVDSNDLKVFVGYWLQTGECIPSDLDRNGSVDFKDFAIFGS